MNEKDIALINRALAEMADIKKMENINAKYVILQERINLYKYLLDMNTDYMEKVKRQMHEELGVGFK